MNPADERSIFLRFPAGFAFLCVCAAPAPMA